MSSTGPSRQRSLKDRLKDTVAQSWPRRRGSQGSNQSKGGRPYFIPSTVALPGSANVGKLEKGTISLGSSDSFESPRDNGWLGSGSISRSQDLNEQFPSSRTKSWNSKSEEVVRSSSVSSSSHVMMTSASSASPSGSESSRSKDGKVNQEKKISKHVAVQPPGTFIYKVDTNDTLTSVAARFETVPSELVKLNRLVNRLVFPGQVIYVPHPKGDLDGGEHRHEWEDDNKTKSEDGLESFQGSNASPPPNSIQTSPKPGRVERVGHHSSSSPPHYRSNLVASKRLSEEEEQKLDKECIERFLKINVKHITDGQGVVDGVLLVTPNAVMFDPSVVNTLVMEHGVEKYGVIAPMDYVANAALYNDIAHMKVRHAPAMCVAVGPRPEIYRGKKDLKESDGPCRSESQQAVKGSVSDKADLDLSEDDVAEEEDDNLTENEESRTGKVKLESRTRSGGTEADDEYSSDSEVFADDESKRGLSGKRQASVEQNECPSKDYYTLERPCEFAQNSDAQVEMEAERLRGIAVKKDDNQCTLEADKKDLTNSLLATRGTEEAEEALEKSNISRMVIAEVEESDTNIVEVAPELETRFRMPLKLMLDDSKVPKRRSSYEPPSPSIDGWVIATRNLLEHRRGSTPDAYVNEAVNPYVNEMYAEAMTRNSQLADVPEHKCLEPSAKNGGRSKEDIRVEFKSEVTIEDKKDLFQAMDKLIPRPARHSDDQPLYLCLRMGRPLNKKRLSSTTPIMSYGQRKMRSEYWFGIPKERVDDLYNFFQHWAPGVYGDIEQMDLHEKGFELVKTDDEESDEEVLTLLPKVDSTQINVTGSVVNILPSAVKKIAGRIPSDGSPADWEIIKAPYAKLFGRLRRDTPSSDSEVVSINEVNEMGDLKRLYSLDLELALPELVGSTEILTEEHRRSIFKLLPARAEGYAWSLIYSASQHGFSLQSMYRSMSKYETPVLLVIQDKDNNVFGAMTSCTFKVSDHFYGTGESFLYTFYPEFKVFRWTGENGFFIKGNTESLAIGAGDGLFGLWMDGDIYHGRSHPCKTYNNDTLSNSEDFCIKLLEAWGFVESEMLDSNC